MRLVKVVLFALAFVVTGGAQALAQETGFEARGGADWTTLDEEQAYLAELDAAEQRLRVRQIGTTTQGRPVQLVQVDVRRPLPRARVARRSSILFVCSQHGDEPSGREACLQLMRELATSEDPELVSVLRRTTLLFIPTANPDGRAANTRENADGVDVNRDHLEYATNEGRAIGEVVRDYKPDLVHDLHEFNPTPEVYDSQILYLWPRNLNVDQTVHDLSERLSTDYVREGVEAAGFTTGVYGIWTRNGQPIAQVAGDGDERILRNSAGLRHSLGILVEANQEPTTAEEAADVSVLNLRRVETQVIAADESLDFFGDLVAAVRRATRRAPILKTREGLAQNEPVYFGGADNDLPDAPDEIDLTPPCRYDLDAAQAAAAASLFATHGIRTEPREGGGVSVPLGQPAEPFIPLVLDTRALHSPFDLPEVEVC